MAPPLAQSPSLVLVYDDDSCLAYQLETGRPYRLNPTATLILELCDGTRDRARVIAELAPILPAAELATCTAWVDWALENRLLIDAAARGSTPPTADELSAAARTLRGEGEVFAAFICQQAAAGLAPETPRHWSTLGELAHIVGRRERAREAYEQYLARVPEDAEVTQILVALRGELPPPRAPDECIEQLYARFADGYESNMCGDLDYQAPARLQEALDSCCSSPGPLDVLELGCGTGLAGSVLRARARTLVGIDLSPAMIEKARATGLYDELAVAEITRWLITERRRFDLIAACDTLIYFGDLRQVVLPAASRLRDGGLMAFTVERGSGPTFNLTDSGRYAHSAEHVRDVAREAGLLVTSLTEGFLRNEYGEAVTGLVAVLRRSTESATRP